MYGHKQFFRLFWRLKSISHWFRVVTLQRLLLYTQFISGQHQNGSLFSRWNGKWCPAVCPARQMGHFQFNDLEKIENLFDRIGRIQQQDRRTWDAVYVAYHSLFWFDHHLHSRQGCFLSILVKTACKTNNRILWICATHAGRTIDNFSLSRCIQQPQENIYRPSSVWRSAHFRLSPTVTCSFSFFIRSNARICIIYIENASIPLPHFPSTILALRPCFFVCFVFR